MHFDTHVVAFPLIVCRLKKTLEARQVSDHFVPEPAL